MRTVQGKVAHLLGLLSLCSEEWNHFLGWPT